VVLSVNGFTRDLTNVPFHPALARSAGDHDPTLLSHRLVGALFETVAYGAQMLALLAQSGAEGGVVGV
jgi:hypothetical protein